MFARYPVARMLTLAAALSVPAFASAQDDEQSKTLATVNGDPVTAAELGQLIQQQSRGRASLEQLGAAQKRQLLDQMIQLELLANHAREEGLADKPDVAAQLVNNQRTVLAQAFVKQMREDGSVSEDKLRQRYQAKYKQSDASSSDKTEYKARHILVDEEKTAQEVIQKLDDGGDFAALAKEYSTGPTSAKGGDLGWFGAGEMVPAFTKALADMDAGDYSDEPVKTQFGWHVIKLADTRKAQPPKFEEVRDQLAQAIMREKVQSRITELRDAAEVDIQADWKAGAGQNESGQQGGGSEQQPSASEDQESDTQ